MQSKIIVLICTLLFLGVACTEDTKKEAPTFRKAARNPNGDSELALLMRDLEEECIQIKKQIENGEPIQISIEVERIKTAVATDPDKAASATYQQFADGYIDLVHALEQAPAETLESHYKGMVSACMGCHKALCPGPMVRIKKLF